MVAWWLGSARVEDAPEVGREGLWFVFEVVPGDPGGRVASGLELAVSGLVVAEGGAGAVGGPAIELGDQALSGPEAVITSSGGSMRWWARIAP